MAALRVTPCTLPRCDTAHGHAAPRPRAPSHHIITHTSTLTDPGAGLRGLPHFTTSSEQLWAARTGGQDWQSKREAGQTRPSQSQSPRPPGPRCPAASQPPLPPASGISECLLHCLHHQRLLYGAWRARSGVHYEHSLPTQASKCDRVRVWSEDEQEKGGVRGGVSFSVRVLGDHP